MPDLRDALQSRLEGRTVVVGIGNAERGDDGFGVRLAESLREDGYADVILAGCSPEGSLHRIAHAGVRTVLLLDAVRMGRAPGTVALLDAAQIAVHFPQVSTHTISLGTLARVIEAAGPRVVLLGVEPESLCGCFLSPVVQATLNLLRDALAAVLVGEAISSGGRP